MTQKDYIAVAAMLKGERDAIIRQHPSIIEPDGAFSPSEYVAVGTLVETQNIATRMADIFAADNNRFKRDVFMRACGLES